MRINIEPLKRNEDITPIDFNYELKILTEEHLTALDAEKIDFIRISGNVGVQNTKITISYTIETAFDCLCARCTEQIKQNIRVSGEKIIAEQSEDADDDNNFYIIEDSFINLDDFAMEFLGLDLPSKYLCNENCKGLCSKCGKNLNEGDCTCPQKEKKLLFLLDGKKK